jgi:hypothetical protein
MSKITLSKEYLQDRFIHKKWSYFQIYQETGWSKATINKALGDFGLRRKRSKLNLNNQLFGKLTVLKRAPNKRKSTYWHCKCVCGNFITVMTGNLMSGNTSSCGCINHLKGAKNACWKGEGLLGGRYWNIMRSNASKRGIHFNLQISEAWALFEKQKARCALTNLPLILSNDNSRTASLDRIDSSLGYIKRNIQWVHKDVNKAKNTFSQQKFIDMCKAVTSHHS